MAEDSTLSLDDAARRLGVHYQTAYRWVRSGRLPAVLVDGRYRVGVDDLEALEVARRTPSAPPPPSGRRLDRQRAAMGRALVDGDETKAAAIVRTLVASGTPVVRLIEEVVAPPLVDIGASWKRGETTIS
ncbi:MAG: helix-turn-helix domain-containing protein, partial [Actinomycetota bacterium]